jgi:hypothetical protein
MLYAQWWYTPPDLHAPGFDPKLTVDTTVSFTFANFQYILVGLALAQSYGVFRERVVRNWLVSVTVLTQLTVASLFILFPNDGLAAAFSLVYPPPGTSFPWLLWSLALCNGLVGILFQRFLVPHMSPDEDPFDVDALVRELPLVPPSLGTDGTRIGMDAPTRRRWGKAPTRHHYHDDVHTRTATPDPQLTLLPRMRWRTPHYVTVEKVASPVWSAMSTAT